MKYIKMPGTLEKIPLPKKFHIHRGTIITDYFFVHAGSITLPTFLRNIDLVKNWEVNGDRVCIDEGKPITIHPPNPDYLTPISISSYLISLEEDYLRVFYTKDGEVGVLNEQYTPFTCFGELQNTHNNPEGLLWFGVGGVMPYTRSENVLEILQPLRQFLA